MTYGRREMALGHRADYHMKCGPHRGKSIKHVGICQEK
jgi:hypothetical protein